MQIGKNKVVSFNYTLKDHNDVTIDSTEGKQPLTYLHGHEGILKSLEDHLVNKKEGDTFQITIEPEKGYGVRQDKLMQSISKKNFENIDEIHPGMQFDAKGSNGPMVVTVIRVDEDEVIVDGNHPLAGVTLSFDIEVVSIRDAESSEIEHGHVHGEGGITH